MLQPEAPKVSPKASTMGLLPLNEIINGQSFAVGLYYTRTGFQRVPLRFSPHRRKCGRQNSNLGGAAQSFSSY